MTSRTLDVRELEPRERHTTIFERLTALEPGETMRPVNDHDPVPLPYQLDAERPGQFAWDYIEDGTERWVVDITSMARVFDARPLLAAGEEPFEPVPLEAVLGEQGFRHLADHIDEETWRVTFLRQ
ncbi:MAG: DUF2249 domain-containing protein [Acidimicrobiia bacterium]